MGGAQGWEMKPPSESGCICRVLTKHRQVDHALAVACGEGGVFADVSRLV